MSLKDKTKEIVEDMDLDLEIAEKELTKDFDDEDIDELDEDLDDDDPDGDPDDGDPDDGDPDDSDPDEEHHKHKPPKHGKPIPYAPKNGRAPHLKHLYANYGGEVMPYINMFDLSLSYETSDIELLYHLCERINKMIDIINAENKYINRLTDWTEKKIHKLFKHQKKFENYLMELLEEFENEMDQKFNDFAEEIQNEIDEFETLVKEEITAMQEEIQDFEKDITERMENFENEVNERLDSMDKEIADFENEMKLRADNFENTINNALTEFETEMRTRADVFEQTMEKEQSNYENSMNERATNFESSIITEINDYENSMNKRASNFESSITTEIDEFETLITDMHNAFSDEWTTKLNDFENRMETRADSFESNLKDEWNDFKQKFSEMYNEYITDITNQWESFRTELAEEFKNLSDELLQEQNDYEAKMNQNYENFTDSIESYIEECCENVNARITEFEDEYNERLENTTRDEVDKVAEDYVNSAIFELIQNSEEFRTAISNVIEELLQESDTLAKKIKDIVDEIMRGYDIDEKVKNFFDENFNTYLTKYLDGNEKLLEIIDNEIASKVPDMLTEFLYTDEFKERVEHIVDDMEWTEVDTSLTDAINLIQENKPRFIACCKDELKDELKIDCFEYAGEYFVYKSYIYEDASTTEHRYDYGDIKLTPDTVSTTTSGTLIDTVMIETESVIGTNRYGYGEQVNNGYIYLYEGDCAGSYEQPVYFYRDDLGLTKSEFEAMILSKYASEAFSMYDDENDMSYIYSYTRDPKEVRKVCDVPGEITGLVTHNGELAYVLNNSNSITIISDIHNYGKDFSVSSVTNEYIKEIYDIYWTDTFLGVNFKSNLVPDEINDFYVMAFYPFNNYSRFTNGDILIDYDNVNQIYMTSQYHYQVNRGYLRNKTDLIATNTYTSNERSTYVPCCGQLASVLLGYLNINNLIGNHGTETYPYFSIYSYGDVDTIYENFADYFIADMPIQIQFNNYVDIRNLIIKNSSVYYVGGNSSSTDYAEIETLISKNSELTLQLFKSSSATLTNVVLNMLAAEIDSCSILNALYLLCSDSFINSANLSNSIDIKHNSYLLSYVVDLRNSTTMDYNFSL